MVILAERTQPFSIHAARHVKGPLPWTAEMLPGGQPCPAVVHNGTYATLCRHTSVPVNALWLKELLPDWSTKQPTTHLRSSLLLGAKRLHLPLSAGGVGNIFVLDNLREPLVSARPHRIHIKSSDTHRCPKKNMTKDNGIRRG